MRLTLPHSRRCDPSAAATGFGAYSGMRWEEGEARQIAAALTYAAEKCKLHKSAGPLMVRLDGNFFGEVGERLISRAVQFSKTFAGAKF